MQRQALGASFSIHFQLKRKDCIQTQSQRLQLFNLSEKISTFSSSSSSSNALYFY